MMVETLLPRREVHIEPDAFREWLEARRTTIVGISCDDSCCPLSEYLTEQNHIRYYVGDDACGVALDRNFYQLPAWASAFVHRIDAIVEYQELPVTGEQALEVYEWTMAHGSLSFSDEF